MAIGLQVVIAAHGGRLCYAEPITPDDCAIGCCHADEPFAPIMNANAAVDSMAPFGPVDSECCIEQHLDDFDAPSAKSDMKQMSRALKLEADADRSWLDISGSRSVQRYGGRMAHPPPSMRVIRATVLLI